MVFFSSLLERNSKIAQRDIAQILRNFAKIWCFQNLMYHDRNRLSQRRPKIKLLYLASWRDHTHTITVSEEGSVPIPAAKWLQLGTLNPGILPSILPWLGIPSKSSKVFEG